MAQVIALLSLKEEPGSVPVIGGEHTFFVHSEHPDDFDAVVKALKAAGFVESPPPRAVDVNKLKK